MLFGFIVRVELILVWNWLWSRAFTFAGPVVEESEAVGIVVQ